MNTNAEVIRRARKAVKRVLKDVGLRFGIERVGTERWSSQGAKVYEYDVTLSHEAKNAERLEVSTVFRDGIASSEVCRRNADALKDASLPDKLRAMKGERERVEMLRDKALLDILCRCHEMRREPSGWENIAAKLIERKSFERGIRLTGEMAKEIFAEAKETDELKGFVTLTLTDEQVDELLENLLKVTPE